MTKISDLPPVDTRYVYPTPPISDPISERDHDNQCVIVFSAYMRQKLAEARDKGRGGWWNKDECTQGELSKMLIEHLFKGDPRDVANFCMFLHARGESIARDVVNETADQYIIAGKNSSQAAPLDSIADTIAARVAMQLDARVRELQTRLDEANTSRMNLHKQLADLTNACVEARSRTENASHSFSCFRDAITKSYHLLGWNHNGVRISEGSSYVGRNIGDLPANGSRDL